MSIHLSRALHYPFSEQPQARQMWDVAPGVRWLRMPLPFDLDHVNLWLVADGEGWAIIDTGYGMEAVCQHWDVVLATLAAPVTRIIVTHFHPDHFGLAAWLEEKTGAPIYMTLGEYLTGHAIWHQLPGHDLASLVDLLRAHGLDAAGCAALTKLGNSYRHGVPGLPPAYRRLQAGSSLTLGGQEWRVLIGHGHTTEHAMLHCPALGLLISGDILLPRISTNIGILAANPHDDPLSDYLDTLDRLADLPADTLVLPSHGLPFVGVPTRTAELRAHHHSRLDLLVSACSAPRSAVELIPVLFTREIDPLRDPLQNFFALSETIAHLNLLEHAGRLLRQEDADGIIRFRTTY